MSVTVARFKKEFPEFEDISFNLCDQRIRLAEKLVSSAVFGEIADRMVMLKAADYMSRSPLGEKARLEPVKTIYGQEFSEIARQMSMGVGRVS